VKVCSAIAGVPTLRAELLRPEDSGSIVVVDVTAGFHRRGDALHCTLAIEEHQVFHGFSASSCHTPFVRSRE
jgi:hypothetical protein